MRQSDTSQMFAVPFGDQADSSTITTIPQSKTAIGRASMALGFPKETFTPIAAGGVPPYGEDINGILHMLAQAARAAEAGLVRPFSQNYANSINGYPLGAIVAHPSISGRYVMNTQDNNTAAPPGNGWIDPLSDFVTNEAMAASLQQEVTRAEAAEAALENNTVSRSGDTMSGSLAIQYTKNWGFGRGGGEFDLKMQDGPERFYGQLYRGTGDQTLGILGVSDETGDRQWKLRSNGSVLSPGGGVLPEVLGMNGRVVIQSFVASGSAGNWGINVNFPVSFKPGTVPQVFTQINVEEQSNTITRVSPLTNNSANNAPQITNTGFSFQPAYAAGSAGTSGYPWHLQVLAIGVM